MTIIASVGNHWELGRDGDLCWHIPEDLRRFKRLTMDGTVIMGRKTWDSLPKKPLPGRTNIVISRGEVAGEGFILVRSLEEALNVAGSQTDADKIFVIGGESVYRAAMPLADRLEITRIYAEDTEADKFFPEITPDEWDKVETTEPAETASGLRYGYETYRRHL